MKWRPFIVLVGLLVWQPGGGAQGQSRIVERPKGERAPFDAAVNALGMERGIRRDQRSINAIYFVASGTMSRRGADGARVDREVTRAVFGMSYHLPAIRSDVTWRPPDGEAPDGETLREIEVTNGDLAWNETSPGVGAARTDDSAADRLSAVWLTPQGALRAMVEARAKDESAVTVGREDGATTFATTLEGGPFLVVLDAEHRPRQLRWTRAGREIVVEYFDYVDWELLDVFFPKRIVQRVDGHVVADLVVSEFRSNPYVVFPIPASLRDESS